MPQTDLKKLSQNVKLTSDFDIVKKLRMTKSNEEIDKIKNACGIAADAFSRVPEIAFENVNLDEVFRKFQALCLESGADWVPYLAGGGHGAISVTSNIAPRQMADMHNAWQAGDFATAQQINTRMIEVHDAMFCEASPGPVKYAAELLGICSAETRLPLCEIADTSKARVEAALRGAGLMN